MMHIAMEELTVGDTGRSVGGRMDRTRRDFIGESSRLLAGAALLADAPSLLAASAPAVSWPIGSFNRPWTQWTFDETLGHQGRGLPDDGALDGRETDPFIAADATPEYLDGLKRRWPRAASRQTWARCAAATTSRSRSVKSLQKEIENAACPRAEVRDAVQRRQGGAVRPVFSRWPAPPPTEPRRRAGGDEAPRREQRRSDEIVAAMKKMGQPNFKIWYDAGNIIRYIEGPGRGDQADGPVVTRVVREGLRRPKGDVMIQFGTGKVTSRAFSRC